jgi:hypothetical protein
MPPPRRSLAGSSAVSGNAGLCSPGCSSAAWLPWACCGCSPVREQLADDTDVITWLDLHTTVAPPIPTANWSHVENGKITRINVTFDPRSLTPPGQ